TTPRTAAIWNWRKKLPVVPVSACGPYPTRWPPGTGGAASAEVQRPFPAGGRTLALGACSQELTNVLTVRCNNVYEQCNIREIAGKRVNRHFSLTFGPLH